MPLSEQRRQEIRQRIQAPYVKHIDPPGDNQVIRANGNGRGTVITYKGVKYPSIRKAAEITGDAASSIRWVLGLDKRKRGAYKR